MVMARAYFKYRICLCFLTLDRNSFMKVHELLNNALELISVANSLQDPNYIIIKSTQGMKVIGIKKNDYQLYASLIESIFLENDTLHPKFSKENIFKFIEKQIFNKYIKKEKFEEKDNDIFFNELELIEKQDSYIIAPISGIRLDKLDRINISIFEIGKANCLKGLINTNAYEYYIAVKINDFYDKDIAIQQAHNLFLDFIRIISFMSGISNKKLAIKVGLPAYPSLDIYQIYKETNSFYMSKNLNTDFFDASLKNEYINKIPIDDDFFCKNDFFHKLWIFLERYHTNPKSLNDMESRLLNCSIAVGESLFNSNTKNSIIYTSIALETLLSLDERELFQASIGEKISEGFAYLIGKTPETRIEASKFVKKFYGIRSAIVHGGKANINNDYTTINQYLRSCVQTFLNDKDLSEIRTLQQFRELLQKAKYSY